MKNKAILTFVILLLLTPFMYAQQSPHSVKIYHEDSNDKVILYADNPELHAISLVLDLQLTNMAFSKNAAEPLVIPGKSQRFKLGEVSRINPKAAYFFNYRYKWGIGDVNARHDENYVYDLPYQKGTGYVVNQGYNGVSSHQGENALDFTMPVSTPVLAAREGIVVKVVQNNTQSCPKEECKQFNNYVMIMHSDGSYASYVHIKHMGANVKLGDSVQKGDLIAYSGNVGWSAGPHLHFVCFTGGIGKLVTQSTKFKTTQGAIVLKQGNSYHRDY